MIPINFRVISPILMTCALIRLTFLYPGSSGFICINIIDGNHERVATFAQSHAGGMATARQQAVSLYYAVRDGIRYDPYAIDLSVEGMRASKTLASGRGWCVPKAVLLAACCRVMGVPAKLGFADVRNHLSTERLRNLMKTDIFFWHGYTSIFIDGKWVKATPAFNIELCDRFDLKPLDFDGATDSIYHPFDQLGNAHPTKHPPKNEGCLNILLIKANQTLYASKGGLNESLFQMSCKILGDHHEIQATDSAAGAWDVENEIQKLKRADIILYHFPL